MSTAATRLNAIPIFSTNDRLGANLSYHFANLFYAHKYNLPVFFPNQSSINSIFLDSIRLFSNKYNETAEVTKDNVQYLNNFNFNTDWYYVQARCLKAIQCDYITYFNLHFRKEFCQIIDTLAKLRGYSIDYEPHKSILVHLRLNDVKKGFPEGTHETCNDVYRDYINNDDYDSCVQLCPYRQASITKSKLNYLINKAQEKYPNREVILVTNPNEIIDLPYKIIANQDESLDLYLLCKSDLLISSRSTFGFMPLLFGNITESWVPKWCHFAMFGLTTKLDKTNNLNYY
tara:strand:- start:540 stop:1403 length:864 start_codon:yes stop_codon:yes gene_type:complete